MARIKVPYQVLVDVVVDTDGGYVDRVEVVRESIEIASGFGMWDVDNDGESPWIKEAEQIAEKEEWPTW